MIKLWSFYIIVYLNLITYFVDNCQNVLKKVMEFALKRSWNLVSSKVCEPCIHNFISNQNKVISNYFYSHNLMFFLKVMNL